jgi:hypothetical protein
MQNGTSRASLPEPRTLGNHTSVSRRDDDLGGVELVRYPRAGHVLTRQRKGGGAGRAPLVGTGAAGPAAAGGRSRCRHRPARADGTNRGEHRWQPGSVRVAGGAFDGRGGLRHGPASLEAGVADLAAVLVDGHSEPGYSAPAHRGPSHCEGPLAVRTSLLWPARPTSRAADGLTCGGVADANLQVQGQRGGRKAGERTASVCQADLAPTRPGAIWPRRPGAKVTF